MLQLYMYAPKGVMIVGYRLPVCLLSCVHPPPYPLMLQAEIPSAPACLANLKVCGQVGKSLIQFKLLETCTSYSGASCFG